MTKAELELQLEHANYKLNLENKRKEIVKMVNGCNSLTILTEMEEEIEKSYHIHTNDWENVALRDNICELAQQLSDNYDYSTLRSINVFMYTMALKDSKLNTDGLFLTPYMAKIKDEHNEKAGVA